MEYRIPDPHKHTFARTNPQTIAQRVALLQELWPHTRSIAEICCGDCTNQWQAYTQQLGIENYCGLDIDPAVVSYNQQKGISCICGNALDPAVLRHFLPFDVLFFGPPLSVACDGHQLLTFSEVRPHFLPFAQLLLGDLGYSGTFVCICPKTTTMGDIRLVYQTIQSYRPEVGLRLIHHTTSTLTGAGEQTELRLKYIELWFTSHLEDSWELRESRPGGKI